jgi:hypothetical protein
MVDTPRTETETDQQRQLINRLISRKTSSRVRAVPPPLLFARAMQPSQRQHEGELSGFSSFLRVLEYERRDILGASTLLAVISLCVDAAGRLHPRRRHKDAADRQHAYSIEIIGSTRQRQRCRQFGFQGRARRREIESARIGDCLEAQINLLAHAIRRMKFDHRCDGERREVAFNYGGA